MKLSSLQGGNVLQRKNLKLEVTWIARHFLDGDFSIG
jgi:hypothetical protein